MVDIADPERRVIALEAAQGENTQDPELGGALGRLAADVSAVKDDVREVKSEVTGLRREFQAFATASRLSSRTSCER